jgi:hypothetical protein
MKIATDLIFSERPTDLHGREQEFRHLREILDAPSQTTQIILLIGEGGIGKTRLLHQIRDHLKDKPCLPYYDFYHVDNFKASSLEQTIIAELDPEHSHFDEYWKKRADVAEARMSGAHFDQKQGEIRATFVECYARLAKHYRSEGHYIYLLFDSVEQAIKLTDEVEDYLQIPTDSSRGGEFWLFHILPQLPNTCVVLSGRPNTLYKAPVTLYADLETNASVATTRVELKGLKDEAITSFALDLCRVPHDGGEFSQKESVDNLFDQLSQNDDQTMTMWCRISGGVPFWIAALFTLYTYGLEGKKSPAKQTPQQQLDGFQEELRRNPDLAISEQERDELREAVIRLLLIESSGGSPSPLFLAIHIMAIVRKGVNEELLRHLLQTGYAESLSPVMYKQLEKLLVVRTRQMPGYLMGDGDREEVLLFLHDEMYTWLDQHPSVKHNLAIPEELIAWYDERITNTKRDLQTLRRRIAQNTTTYRDALKKLETIESELEEETGPTSRHSMREDQRQADNLLRRWRQLELDRLGYLYDQDLAAGNSEYNRLAYTAIISRETGYGVTLRHEALRNLYRQKGGVPEDIQVECVARWLLRTTALDNKEEMDRLRALSRKLYPADKRPHSSEYAYLYLAEAQADLYAGRLYTAESKIEDTLEQAAKQLQDTLSEPTVSQTNKKWAAFLLSEIHILSGYHHRQLYQLSQSINYYNEAIAIHIQHKISSEQFFAIAQRNLAFALSEQGRVEDARERALGALVLTLDYGSEYNVALCRNTLARIEIRDRNPYKALVYAFSAYTALKNLDSKRGLHLCIPVLAEALRKIAEDLDDSVYEQNQLFEIALRLLEQQIKTFKETDPSAERQREYYQTLGGTYRSRGQAKQRRDPEWRNRTRRNLELLDDWQQDFARAIEHFETAKIKAEKDQPRLILVDIHEDIATVYVNREEFGERPIAELEKAEHLVREEHEGYFIQEGIGSTTPPNATTGYWRELGQCQLQRMMCAFGLFENGLEPDKVKRASRPQENAEQERYLAAAGEHLMLMLAYLLQYAHFSPMLTRAKRLALGELRQPHLTEGNIQRVARSIRDTAKRYKIERNSAALNEAEKLVKQAIQEARYGHR